MREVLSFARRVGRKLRAEQVDLLNSYLPRNNALTGITQYSHSEYLSLPYAKYKKFYLEVGFGNGYHLSALAAREKTSCFIGCEPYLNGVASLLKDLKVRQLHNVFIWDDDVNKLIHSIPDHSLDGIHILFPDPWPKKKHHKKRIINSDFIKILHSKIKYRGQLIITTDHVEYARWILNRILYTNYFDYKSTHISDWMSFPKDWVKTKYQKKSEQQGKKNFCFKFKAV